MKAVITLEQYRRIREVKAQRAATPTNKQLARELGLNLKTVEHCMSVPRKRLERQL